MRLQTVFMNMSLVKYVLIMKNKVLVCKNEKYLPMIHWSVSSVMAGPNGSLMGVTKFSPSFPRISLEN